MSLPSLRLKANADRRLRAGHLWVYSNEIDVAAPQRRLLEIGVRICTSEALVGFAGGEAAIACAFTGSVSWITRPSRTAISM